MLFKLKQVLFVFSCVFGIGSMLVAQTPAPDCQIEVDEIDPFDSLRTVATQPVNIGYLIPSQFEEPDGPKLIEEAKALPLYSERDSLRTVFLTFLVPEYHFQVAEKGFTVKVLTDSSDVFLLYAVPDEGVFDKTTNMRTYQHTCLLPMDTYYKLTYHRITRVRLMYRDRERDIEVNEYQGELLRDALQCLGLTVGFLPMTP